MYIHMYHICNIYVIYRARWQPADGTDSSNFGTRLSKIFLNSPIFTALLDETASFLRRDLVCLTGLVPYYRLCVP